MSKIGLFELNNYFNRKIIKLSGYLQFVTQPKVYAFYDNINFNPNDDVSAELVLNFEPQDIKPDYLVEFTDDLLPMNMKVISRWFVIGAVRTLAGQYKMRLRRDVIADNYDGVLSAECFIEKATLNDDDPLIVNDEGMSLNQIKKEEILLKDKSKTAWIVGYVPTNLAAFQVQHQTSMTDVYTTEQELAQLTGINQTIISNLITGNQNVRAFTSTMTLRYINYINEGMPGSSLPQSKWRQRIVFSSDMESVSVPDTSEAVSAADQWPSLYSLDKDAYASSFFQKLRDAALDFGGRIASSGNLISQIQAVLNPMGLLKSSQLNALLSYSGTIIKIGNDFKKMVITIGDKRDLNPKTITAQNIASINDALSAMRTEGKFFEIDATAGIEVDGSTCSVIMTLQDYSISGLCSVTITGNGGTALGKPYRIFCMPYENIRIFNSRDNSDFTSEGMVCRGIAGKMQLNLGTPENPVYLYDIQLLPYCPLQSNIRPTATPYLNISSLYASNYSYIVDGDNNKRGVLIYLDNDSFTASLGNPLTLDESMKVDSNCDMWRLCSPNYQGAFDFNVAKNGGSVSGFTAYCTYKPYTPFIRVAPSFDFLYGQEFGDMRGLICGGDFSLPQSSNAWNTYQLNNKNYQNIFNREIQNLSFSQNIEMRNQLISSSVGVMGDTVKGAAAGSAGGPWGAIAGAVVGGASSIAGAVVDTYTLGAVHKEQRDFAIDRFNYTLGNIKALPNTITKVGSWDISSKIYPFLEHYQCSEQEKEAFKEKIRLDGMTVMRIGKIRDYVKDEPTYIKAEMIRSDDISGDSHIYMAIYEELRKGVYI